MIHRRGFLLASGLALAGCSRRAVPDAEPPERLALLVGVTKYAPGTPWKPLSGPVNDVELWADLLRTRFGFADEGITRLTEDATRPTRAAIVAGFQKLAEDARPGAQVVVLLSGHGTQQPDQVPPDPEDPEPNGMDQVFLPADAGAPDLAARTIPNGIIDDEIRVWLRAIARAGARVWLVCDCCHAGTMLRGDEDEDGVRGFPASKVWPASVIEEAKRNAAPAGLRGAGKSPVKIDGERGIVAFYACRAEERTGEAFFSGLDGDRKLGIFTQALCGLMARG
ncbi:MAG: caspase family protein, partial [Gemmataceae bacterium]|nr:caspase family protein [Gemmataceae bacterium]